MKEENHEEGSKALLNIGAKIACVTLSRKGCYVTDGISEYLIDAYPTDVVDTTGAGDAFAAGFLYGIIKRKSIKESGKVGNFVASRCISEFGCRKGLPYKEDLKKAF